MSNSGGTISNSESFECIICCRKIRKGSGVVLRNCLHKFCKSCLVSTIVNNEDVNIQCPHMDSHSSCTEYIQDQEIRALLKKTQLKNYLERSLRLAETTGDTFHCKTVNCVGWCYIENMPTEFICPCCQCVNCIHCEVS